MSNYDILRTSLYYFFSLLFVVFIYEFMIAHIDSTLKCIQLYDEIFFCELFFRFWNVKEEKKIIKSKSVYWSMNTKQEWRTMQSSHWCWNFSYDFIVFNRKIKTKIKNQNAFWEAPLWLIIIIVSKNCAFDLRISFIS